MTNRDILDVLRGVATIEAVCAATGIGEAEFRRERDAWLRRSLPPTEASLQAAIDQPVEILRDRRGIPHIYAQTTADLHFGLGFAMAEDRLWQMDFFRRRGSGTLAAILGLSFLTSDVTHRTLDLDRIARAEAERLDPATAKIAAAFVAGINRAIEAAHDRLPIEFMILDYEPEPWTIADVLVALRGFWWSLNGRLQSIVAAEAALLLPEGPLRDAYLTPNLADERILPADATFPDPILGLDPAKNGGSPRYGSDDGTTGSNNWAVGKNRTTTGAGILGSDPHQPFALPANWYECHLVSPSMNVAGAAWAGAPGIWFGRNQNIAWGLTNNNVSLRDLYVEDVDPTDSTRYRDGATWRAFTRRQVEIEVRGEQSHHVEVLATARGPIVNALIPSVQPDGDPPVSLRWVGLEPLDDLRAILAVGNAQNWNDFRGALRNWAIPTFNWGFADVDGNVGYQCASRVPVRGRSARGYRKANNPDDRWLGYLPFEAQPTAFNPKRGFTSSANNSPVPDDYPYSYGGAFASGERAIRVRETIETNGPFDRRATEALQNDTLSVTARQLVPSIVARLEKAIDPDVQSLRGYLASWDYRYEISTPAPTCFEMFLRTWKTRVASEHFPPHLVALASGQGSVFARLLLDDDLTWFRQDTNAVVFECARLAMSELTNRFGSDPDGWLWGKVHQLYLRHPLSNPATADAFDVGPRPISGAASTVRNTGLGESPLFGADSGAEYRLIVDLADQTRLWATQNIGQSGQPGSAHYRDQFDQFVDGKYHVLELNRYAIESEPTSRVQLRPLP